MKVIFYVCVCVCAFSLLVWGKFISNFVKFDLIQRYEQFVSLCFPLLYFYIVSLFFRFQFFAICFFLFFLIYRKGETQGKECFFSSNFWLINKSFISTSITPTKYSKFWIKNERKLSESKMFGVQISDVEIYFLPLTDGYTQTHSIYSSTFVFQSN